MAHAIEELDGEPDGRQLVDVPEQHKPRLFATALARHEAPRRPIVPAYVRNPTERSQVLRWLGQHFGHLAAYHATRLPKYAGKAFLRAPIGAIRVAALVLGWVFDAEGSPARAEAIAKNDLKTYIALTDRRNDRVKLRLFTAGGGLVGVIGLAVTLGFTTGLVPRVFLALGVIAVLGWVGSPRDKPLLDRAVVVPQARRLTSDEVTRALTALALPGISQALAKNPNAITFVAPITRDGPGWRADIDLPSGVTCTDVIERRDRLASALGRPLGCVWPDGNTEIHPGRLVLWVGDTDMAVSKQATWPLAKTGSVDLFAPFPFGTDPRGRMIPLELMYSNLLIGSLPGAGKTFSLRVPLLAAALDPRAELWCYELKGSGDLEALAGVSSRYASGADDDTIEDALHALRSLRKECGMRAEKIKKLPKDVCPENKVTTDLAGRKSLGLHPLVVAIDECQELFSHPEHGKEAGELAEKVVKLGRALGVILLLATQRPDSKSLPTGVSANVGTRFCLRVMGQVENDMILGTSAYRNGVRATMFTRRDKGVGYLVGADDPQIVRSYYLDGQAAENVIARARAAREAAGTLFGHAAGEQPQPEFDLLDDILRVINLADGERVWSEKLCPLLAVLRPAIYSGWGPEQLAANLKPLGVDTIQIWGEGLNRKGVDRSHVLAALEARRADRALRAESGGSRDLVESR